MAMLINPTPEHKKQSAVVDDYSREDERNKALIDEREKRRKEEYSLQSPITERKHKTPGVRGFCASTCRSAGDS
jgi:hypothetical protein